MPCAFQTKACLKLCAVSRPLRISTPTLVGSKPRGNVTVSSKSWNYLNEYARLRRRLGDTCA